MLNQAAKLRQMIAAKQMVVAPGAYDCLTAKLIEHAAFPAVYMTGGGTAAALLGYPDYGLPTMSEMADNAGRIATAVKVPVIADADTGFGNELNVVRTVRSYEQHGVAALHIEDQVFPKRCGHFEGKEVVAIDEFIAKIRAAVAARQNPDTIIIARTDALPVEGFDSAVARMSAALAAGADVAFLEAVQTVEQMAQVPKLLKGPCMLNIPPVGGKTPRVTLDQAAAMGYKITILPGLLSRHVMASCEMVLKELAQTREYPKSAMEPPSMQAFAQRMGSDEWDQYRTQFR